MTAAPVSSKQIAAIWQAYTLGAVETIAVPRRGCSNACYFVNHDRVARFQVTELPRDKFRREKAAYDLLRAGEVPVPEVLVLDETRALVP